MTTPHQFGGKWTVEKLERVRKYLCAYTTIFNKNPKAQKLHTIYVDAFAGTGYRTHDRNSDMNPPLFSDEETQAFLKGSARIALEVEPPFKEYIFIERDPDYAKKLFSLRDEFLPRRGKINIINSDANAYLQKWVRSTNWRMTRAVVFLDPYGMSVEWKTIQALGQTRSVDLWILFPLGVAVNRLLTRAGPPSGTWAEALTRIFGTDEWKDVFYKKEKQLTLFGEEETYQKQADFKTIGEFFNARLKTVFADVAPNPLPLTNSRNNPLYLLCFAAANPRGAPIAIKIARDILKP